MTKFVHDPAACRCPVVDFPEQHIPGQLDALDEISRFDEEADRDGR